MLLIVNWNRPLGGSISVNYPAMLLRALDTGEPLSNFFVLSIIMVPVCTGPFHARFRSEKLLKMAGDKIPHRFNFFRSDPFASYG